MVQICEANVPKTPLTQCDPCTDLFWSYSRKVRIGRNIFIVTRRYRLRTCFAGLGIGKHTHSMTLLPGEQVDIEIVRRAKYERALHEQRSIESEFETELQTTTRNELETQFSMNVQIDAEAGFKILGIGAKTSVETELEYATIEKSFREVIAKNSSRVSRKHEIAIDVKSEVENTFRSLRRVRNPNPCQPVTFHYFQMAKKYKAELFLIDVRFDELRPVPLLERPMGAVAFRADAPYRQNLDLNVVAPSPLSLGGPEVAGVRVSSVAGRELRADVASIAGLPAVQVPIEPPPFRELDRDQLLTELGASLTKAQIARLRPEIDKFLARPVNKPRKIDTYEYCVHTSGLYVETHTSPCAACLETDLKLKALEVEKAAVDIELARKQLDGEDE